MTARMPVEDLKKPLLRGGGGGARLAEASSSVSEPASPVVGILGTGDFSRSLARRLVASGYRVVVGSRSPRRHAALFPEEAELTDQRGAASEADLVFVAVFAEHYDTLCGLREALAGKALVDVSNAAAVTREGEGPAQAERLAALFPESRVVKGFNVLSAWTLQTGPRDGNRQVPLCGDSAEAKACVSRLCRRLGFVPVDLGGLGAARDIENAPLRLFPAWRRPLLCALLLFLFFYAYNAVRDVLHPYVTAGKRAFYKLPLETVNVTLPAVALVLLALVYLPGVLAALLQLHRGTKYRRFPGWLAGWLARRKQLGLLGFLCAALHAVFSLSLPMRRAWRYKQLDEAFRQVKEQRASSWVEEEVWRMELYLCVGVLALGLLSLLAVTSLPSVASALNWREFSFVQNRLGYLALVLTTLHTLLFGWDRALDPARYRWLLPPTFCLALALPCAVLLGRLALALPCLGGRLDRIRRGREVRGGRGEGRGDGRSLEDVSGV